ncbi:Alpha-galactosidase [Trichostrongylus colubriformis]|uniref:Alpha-galactosidase n=1 Tax=Trichostrongylus colubriformis TaxID=6319 RepID=A0AAN8FDN3_TRICO
MLWFWFYTILLGTVSALENGLARTPPMGWMSWTAFYCEMDCVKHPRTCINENLYMEMADALVTGGYRDAGYVSVHVDDCWMGRNRDPATGRLIADPYRFPSGMHNLARYMHARGLKFGIYEDFGTKTCAGFPGSLGHLQLDANTFAEWEVDYLKLDGCNVDTSLMPAGYAGMERALNATRRPIVYSCSWPAYMIDQPQKVDYYQIAKSCNLWRNFDDINSSWKSILSIIDYYDHNQDKHIPTHGPGHWHDPDMLVIGNPGITINMAVAQMTIWSIWSAPLIMSNDLRTIAPEFQRILLNRDVIAIDQDPMGRMGRLVANEVEFKLRNLGLTNERGYILKDLWNNVPLMRASPDDMVRFQVPATGAAMYRAELKKPNRWLENNRLLEVLTNRVPIDY